MEKSVKSKPFLILSITTDLISMSRRPELRFIKQDFAEHVNPPQGIQKSLGNPLREDINSGKSSNISRRMFIQGIGGIMAGIVMAQPVKARGEETKLRQHELEQPYYKLLDETSRKRNAPGYVVNSLSVKIPMIKNGIVEYNFVVAVSTDENKVDKILAVIFTKNSTIKDSRSFKFDLLANAIKDQTTKLVNKDRLQMVIEEGPDFANIYIVPLDANNLPYEEKSGNRKIAFMISLKKDDLLEKDSVLLSGYPVLLSEPTRVATRW